LGTEECTAAAWVTVKPCLQFGIGCRIGTRAIETRDPLGRVIVDFVGCLAFMHVASPAQGRPVRQ